jgi:hypothetical protein
MVNDNKILVKNKILAIIIRQANVKWKSYINIIVTLSGVACGKLFE